MNLPKLRKAIRSGSIIWRKHALLRMIQRNIAQKEVLAVLMHGKIAQEYQSDRPYPSCLMTHFINRREICVVASYNERDNMVYIITAFEKNGDLG